MFSSVRCAATRLNMVGRASKISHSELHKKDRLRVMIGETGRVGQEGRDGFTLRPATAADQQTIVEVIRQARINPQDLKWPNFIVAEKEQQIIGTGQIKTHGDGSRELASIAVRPAYQRQGVGRRICRVLIAREQGPLYLTCRSEMETYYVQFGFRAIGPEEMPPYYRRLRRIVRVITGLTFGRIKLSVMLREGDHQEGPWV
ncbi:MAG: N-acetyltransferase [Chloroflexi bacterium]|nr:N-acetyltransferase [Chloroflexota bacterium]